MNESAVLDIWAIHVPSFYAQVGYMLSVLSATERERAFLMQDQYKRQTFITGRYAVRFILSSYLNCCASEIPIFQDGFGKPHICSADNELSFSVSHSADFVQIATSETAAVGVDIEKIRPVQNQRAIASHFFSPEEQHFLASLADAERDISFFRTWTSKEAILKALGCGLAFPMASFTALPGAGRVLSRVGGLNWQTLDVVSEKGYVASVAFQCDRPVEHFVRSTTITQGMQRRTYVCA